MILTKLSFDKDTLEGRLGKIVMKVFSLMTAALLILFIFLTYGVRKNVTEYACSNLQNSTELAGYQIGRELILNNQDVAKKLVNSFEKSLNNISSGNNIALSLLPPKNLDSTWECKITFNKINFSRPIVFGNDYIATLAGTMILFDNQVIFIPLATYIFFLISCFCLLARHLYLVFNKEVSIPLQKIANFNFNIKTEHLSKEIKEVAFNLISSHDRLIKSEKTISELKMSSMISDIATQVAHDIRSPVSALNVVLAYDKELSDNKKSMVRSAINRINDIANNLLEKSKVIKQNSLAVPLTNKPKEIELIQAILESILSEKRMQFRNYTRIKINFDARKAYGLFSTINSSEFKRIISNLINNSVESFDDRIGTIDVTLYSVKNELCLTITDTGKGIPAHIISNIGNKGFSYGKENTTSGTGLGIYHAKRSITEMGGDLKIESKEGKGTTVTIMLPSTNPPTWFVDSIKFENNYTVVIIDDDSNIHSMWDEKFYAYQNVSLKHFISPKVFKKWFTTSEVPQNILYLIDYEYYGDATNGLDLIAELGINSKSILVTGNFEDADKIERCKQLNTKLLPKNIAAHVPIHIIN